MNNAQINQFTEPRRQLNFTSSKGELNLSVLEIDRKFLESTLREQIPSKQHGGWIGKCPHCAASDKTKKRQAYLTPRETGYVFHCCSCGVSQTTFHFLAATQGDSRAQDYAQARWDAGELCGGGWNCPLPQKVRERLLKEKDERRKTYKAGYIRQRSENKARHEKVRNINDVKNQ